MKTKIIISALLNIILSVNTYLVSQTITLDVGVIEGSFSVSPSGAATYQIPLECPSVLSNMQPNISLVYNSQGSDGVMGMGWQISGISSITQGSKSIFSDNSISGFNILNKEKFFLNGNPLLLVSGIYGADGAVYQTENKDFSRIVSNGQNNSPLYPNSFIVNTKDGRTIDFSVVDRATHKTNPIRGIPSPVPYRWLPKLETDLQGNLIKYSYMSYSPRSSLIHQTVLTRIEYGGNLVNTYFPVRGEPEYAYKTSIQFVYEDKSIVKKTYINDYYFEEGKLLKQIIIRNRVNTTHEVLRTYDFTYKLENDKYLLTTINLKNGNESKVNPTQITWGIDNKSIQVNNFEIPNFSHYLSEVTDRYFSSADIDGDGTSDLVEYYHRNIYNYRYNDNNYSIQSSSNYVKVHKFRTNSAGNIEYDKSLLDKNIGATFNFNDFKSINGSVFYPALFGNQSKTIISPNYSLINGEKYVIFTDVLSQVNFVHKLKYTNELTAYACGDLNNDGIDEIVSMEKVNVGNTYTDAGVIHYIQKIDFSTPYLTTQDKLYRDNIPNIVKPKDVFIYDFNGDGLNDIVYTSSSETVFLKNMGGTKASDGIVHVSFQKIKTIPIKSDFSTIRVGDFNGDGLPDFLYNEHCNTVWKLALNTGEFDFEYITLSNFTAKEEDYTDKNDDKEDCIITDFNGDGMSDVILIDAVYDKKDDIWSSPWGVYNRTIITWYQSTGSGLTPVNSKIVYNDQYTFNKYNTTGDFNGDGRDDIFSLKSNLFSVNQSENGYFHFFSNTNFSAKLITKITDGYGNTTELQYQPLTYAKSSDNTIFYEKGKNAVYPISDIQIPLYCIKNVKTPVSNINFSYKGAKFHFTGKGFLGFESIIKTDKVNETISISNVTLDHVNVMPLKQVEAVLKVQGDSIAKTETLFTNIKIGNTYNSVPSSVTQRDFLKDITTKTVYSYDSYNNPTVVETTIGSNSVITNTSYYNSTSSIYVIGQPLTITTTKYRNGAAWIDKESIVYNEKRLPIIKNTYTGTSGNNKTGEIRWEYDIYGNVISQKYAPYNVTSFSENTFTYDSLGRHLVTETNVLNQRTTYSNFDKYGNAKTIIDYKNRLTTRLFDTWGRQTSVTSPSNVTETVTFAWGGQGLYTVTKTITGQPAAVIHYDALGRELRKGNQRFDGNWQYVDNAYDNKGRLEKVSLPFKGSSPSYWNTYTYDTYNRPTKITEASGKTATWSYNGLSVTETKNGIATTKTIDASGALVSVSDPSGTITYALRADGQPSSITAPGGVVTSFGYDAFGRQTSITDPSAGTQTFNDSYTAAGVLTRTVKDANNKTVTTVSDKYGRVTNVNRPEFNTSYVYNTDGLLTNETSTNGTSAVFTYDSYDRPATARENAPDGKYLLKTFAYATGNVSSVQYTSQNGSIGTENFVYAYGHNTEIKLNNTTSIWKLTEENALGQPTKATTGALARTYGYTAFGMPTGRTAGSIQNFTYNFDVTKGNLTSRTDNTRSKTESFQYDNLNRLTNAAGQAIGYAANGNITSIGGVGTLAYGNMAKPYQVTMLTPTGTAVPIREQSVTYTSYQRPNTVTENGITATFAYNSGGDRVKMQVTQGATALLTKYYIGKQYELDVQTNTERLYLGGDVYSAPAVYVKEANVWNIYYICRDYLGSVTHVANANGSLKAEYSYDAWGRLRNPATQVAYTVGTEPALFLARGYTGHEHLTWFGLINMNARLYDAALGRFLSPDPYVQAPDFTQNFNRYSYCLNNPLRYSDPSGEIFVIDDIIIAAAISAVINVQIQAMSGNINSAGDFFLAAGIGALSGALGSFAGQAVAGALGTATTLGGSIANGALIGASGGLAGGFIGGTGNAWMNGANFGQGLRAGLISGGISAGIGGVLGGISGGYSYYKNNLIFQKGNAVLGVEPSDVVPATDKFLSEAQQAWYPDAPMKNIEVFTVEHVPADLQASMQAANASAATRAKILLGKFTGNSEVFFNGNMAFSSAEQLFYSMGHEFIHVSQYAALMGQPASLLGQKGFKDMLDFHAYNYQNTLGGTKYSSFARDEVRDWAIRFPQFKLMSHIYFPWTNNVAFRYPLP